MVNLSVGYVRPNRSLLKLRDEVYSVYGLPARPAEFVTGYKSANNLTGHNADNNGIVHAVDIFTDDYGNIPQPAGRVLAERLRQIGKATGRFEYLIHDMGATTVDPRIAGKFSDWEWRPYPGSSPHSDHIHVSTCDLYWGDPAPVPASVYDSTTPWGIAGSLTPSGGTTPTEKELWETMDEDDLRKIIRDEAGKGVWGYSGKLPEDKNAQTIWRRLVNAQLGVVRAEAQVAALTEAVKQLATSKGLDAAKLDAVVQAAVTKALDAGIVDVDINIKGQPS